jgi:hypothetical protein
VPAPDAPIPAPGPTPPSVQDRNSVSALAPSASGRPYAEGFTLPSPPASSPDTTVDFADSTAPPHTCGPSNVCSVTRPGAMVRVRPTRLGSSGGKAVLRLDPSSVRTCATLHEPASVARVAGAAPAWLVTANAISAAEVKKRRGRTCWWAMASSCHRKGSKRLSRRTNITFLCQLKKQTAFFLLAARRPAGIPSPATAHSRNDQWKACNSAHPARP